MDDAEGRVGADGADGASGVASTGARSGAAPGRGRRALLVGVVAAVVIALVGGVTAGIVLGRGQGSGSSAVTALPPGSPLGPGTGSCANPQDPELRALVDAALPALASATEAPTIMLCRLGRGREVNLEITEGGLAGLFSVVFTPAGEQSPAAATGWVTAEAATASGGRVTVTSRGATDSGGVPLAAQVPPLAAALAPRL